MGSSKTLNANVRLHGNTKKTKGHYRRYVCFVTMLFFGFSLYFINFHIEDCIVDYFRRVRWHLLAVPDRSSPKIPSGFVVDTPGCRIPAMDPFDPLIKEFIEEVDAIDCAAKFEPQLVKSNLTSLYVVHAALAHYNVSDIDQLECCYRPFWRVDGDINKYAYGVDDNIVHGQNCRFFRTQARIDNEFVQVECHIHGTKIYTDFHAFTPMKETTTNQFVDVNNETDALSVLVLGIDSVSRLNFHRQMPLTEAFLREMEAVEMLGYNKVGDNTFPNLTPILSGLSEEELRITCWKDSNVSFDSCPWLWNNYSAAGYRTAFGEDTPYIGIFSYLKVGFVKQPTDYYMRPYMELYEDHGGHTNIMNTNICMGSRFTIEVLLEYALKFVQTMTSLPYFGLFWSSSISHDDLNYAQLGDEVYESALRQLVDSGLLNRTLLIVMSDHGIRWGPICEVYQGRLEERLPLLSFVFPTWFKVKYDGAIGNLRRNANRLTTPFDLHATLVDLLNPSELQKESLRSRISKQDIDSPPRGVSLFLPISKNRTCADAGIEAHWCTCHQSRPLSPMSVIANKMALLVVKHVNHLLKPYSACAVLKLLTVHDARVQLRLKHLSLNTTYSVPKYYVVIVETTPGNALFESTVRLSRKKHMRVTGTVSRINMYGNQSVCVSDFHMKLYCFCHIMTNHLS